MPRRSVNVWVCKVLVHWLLAAMPATWGCRLPPAPSVGVVNQNAHRWSGGMKGEVVGPAARISPRWATIHY